MLLVEVLLPGIMGAMSSVFKLSIFVMGMLVGAGATSLYYLDRIASLEGKVEVRVRNQIIVAETVADEASRARGLSGRTSLGTNEGMLFRFDEAGTYPFWMKDMQFPIDIVWISGFRIVGFEQNVMPEPGVPDSELKLYMPPEPVDKVLELAAGRVKLLRAETDDAVQILPLIKRVSTGT